MDGMRKFAVNSKLYNVVSLDEYCENKELYPSTNTVIEYTTPNEQSMLFPIIAPYEKSYGIKVGQTFSYFNQPTEEDEKIYDPDKVIDFAKVGNIKELIEAQDAVRDLEREMLTTPDDICSPIVGDNDEPAMVALKTAVLQKQIDLDKYEQRFGPNYNNDKRNLNKERISLQMLNRMCNNLDIKATLILEDASPEVPNPMGNPVTVELTRTRGEDND